jgi:DNA mismatch repair protein MutS
MRTTNAPGTDRESPRRPPAPKEGYEGPAAPGPGSGSAGFNSILADGPAHIQETASEPTYFGDLNLDQIVVAVLAGREEYELATFFWQPLRDVTAVKFRQDVIQDLWQADVRDAVATFAAQMRQTRGHLALSRKLHYELQRERLVLEAITVYCDAVRRFTTQLASASVSSSGFRGLRGYLTRYVESTTFGALLAETEALHTELAQVRYEVLIKGARVRVSRYEQQPNLTAHVETTFARFKQGAVKDYRAGFHEYPEVNHVEAQILELVSRLYPQTFARLHEYWARWRRGLDETIVRFDREVQFYLAYLEHIERVGEDGLAFCLPRVTADSHEVRAWQGFDLSLATKLAGQDTAVIRNDLQLTGPERILVVTGPNQGGKTTFARMFGQLHYLASLGLPVPARQAQLALPDQLFTHFEKQESLETLRGKFEDELVRIRAILEHATSNSVLIMNESFGSTAFRDALAVGSEIIRQIISRDARCVFVTFVDELASLSEATVSMMSTVDTEDPARRTYKIERKAADGLAYAAALAEKYQLSYESLTTRIAR